MPIILSLSVHDDILWAAGPEGLFRLVEDELMPVLQPQAELSCCLAGGDFLMVGGAPHGIALSKDEGETWQAAWMSGGAANVLCLAAAPDETRSGFLLAGSAEDGVWRSRDAGLGWTTVNVGLQDFAVMILSWAPPPPPQRWPAWEVVFAGTEEGLYRSPNGGRAWKRCEGIDGAIQSIAIDPCFHDSGVVLAGTEQDGLWRSSDMGRSFGRVNGAPGQIDALTALEGGWLLSDDRSLWHSHDGLHWQSIPDSTPALVLLATRDQVWAGGLDGVQAIEMPVA